MTASGKSTIFP